MNERKRDRENRGIGTRVDKQIERGRRNSGTHIHIHTHKEIERKSEGERQRSQANK